jgi:hypothetical protein
MLRWTTVIFFNTYFTIDYVTHYIIVSCRPQTFKVFFSHVFRVNIPSFGMLLSAAFLRTVVQVPYLSNYGFCVGMC